MIKKHFKGILMSIFKGILFSPFFAVLCIFDMGNTDDLKDPMHWITVGFITILVFIGWYYYKEINPRKSVVIDHNFSIKKTILLIVFLLISMLGWIPITILIENNIVSLFIFILCTIICFVTFLHMIAGIKVFRGKDILIINDKLKYYKNAKIENIRINGNGKYVTLNVIIDGYDNYFKVPKKKAIRYQEEILKNLFTN